MDAVGLKEYVIVIKTDPKLTPLEDDTHVSVITLLH